MFIIRYIVQHIVIATLCVSSFGVLAQSSLGGLLRAVDDGDLRTVAASLDRGLDPNTTDATGNTILMLSARAGHGELVSLLISRKADVNRRSPAGDSALMMAALRGDVDIARRLVAAGAEVNLTGWAPLHYAAFGGHSEVAGLLLEKGADKDALAPNGYTPLMLAARGGHVEAARVILHRDPDVKYRSSDGATAMSVARSKGMPEVVEMLKRAGAVE